MNIHELVKLMFGIVRYFFLHFPTMSISFHKLKNTKTDKKSIALKKVKCFSFVWIYLHREQFGSKITLY